ncbi:hypothetical protein DdX_21453 [Ditylenchus destructor]|uniref:Uncharacterized protein n=1 Tax=Ditylenchus destructor TaxID=166010 RepID=A0AAD4MEV6_9BILA|nr:hypothetical protein DdX_21453 [Ditylenchus destructor]
MAYMILFIGALAIFGSVLGKPLEENSGAQYETYWIYANVRVKCNGHTASGVRLSLMAGNPGTGEELMTTLTGENGWARELIGHKDTYGGVNAFVQIEHACGLAPGCSNVCKSWINIPKNKVVQGPKSPEKPNYFVKAELGFCTCDKNGAAHNPSVKTVEYSSGPDQDSSAGTPEYSVSPNSVSPADESTGSVSFETLSGGTLTPEVILTGRTVTPGSSISGSLVSGSATDLAHKTVSPRGAPDGFTPTGASERNSRSSGPTSSPVIESRATSKRA